MCVHCMTKPLVIQTLLLPFRPCQIVDLAVRNGCSKVLMWETDFYTPPVLGGCALLDNSAPAVYKIQGP